MVAVSWYMAYFYFSPFPGLKSRPVFEMVEKYLKSNMARSGWGGRVIIMEGGGMIIRPIKYQ